MKEGSSLMPDSKTKARLLTEQFKSVFTPSDNSPPPELNGKLYDSITEIIVDQCGITKLLKNHDPSKACGPDDIPTVVLKSCADSVAPAITATFQRSISTGTLPTDWLQHNY